MWIHPEVMQIVPPGWEKDAKTDPNIRRIIEWMDVAYGFGRIDRARGAPAMPYVRAPWYEEESDVS